jgi:hypothetical protein
VVRCAISWPDTAQRRTKETVMVTCQLCRFSVELDDVQLRRGTDLCICVACYYRETDGTVQMPKLLRRELIDALSGADARRVAADRRYDG